MSLRRTEQSPAPVRRLVSICSALVLGVLGVLVVPGLRAASADPSTLTVTPEWDNESTLRNPGMGWMIYAEEFARPLEDAEAFWATVGPYVADASVLYLRLPWSRLEPAEGHYAWNEDDNFKRLVAGARERGLRLAFRVYVDSQDSHRQATPQFVFDAGATRYAAQSNAGFLNPVFDDPVFREKFDGFLVAFGAEYDDPDVVDFVDMNTIGWWGEMHNIPGLTSETWTDSVRWLGSVYRKAFRHVLLALNIHPGNFGYDAIDEQLAAGAVMRRDSFGSPEWFDQEDKEAILRRWPGSLLVAENCYQDFTTRETSCDDSFKPTRAMLERVVNDARQLHANYLDLRHPEDVVTWGRDNADLVREFATKGGYRIGPTRATAPATISVGRAELRVSWQNTGIGRLPNDNPQWGDKYRVSYALLDPRTGEPVHKVVSAADPGGWLAGGSHVDIADLAPTDVPAGRYQLATAIVDSTRGDEPAVRLAVDATGRNGWVVLGEINVDATTAADGRRGRLILVATVVAALAGITVIALRSRRRAS